MHDESADRRFGVVLFDDKEDPGAGWATVITDGRGKARRISGSHELPTDTVWWSNVPYDMFFRRTEVWRNPGLRHDKYLVISPSDVLREWGYDPTTVQAEDFADLSAIAFDRIMRMSWMLLKEVNPKLRIAEAFQGKTLREDLRPLLPELDYPKGEAATVMKSGQAWEEFTATGAKGPKGSRWIMLRRPRLSYAMEMLQTPVPKAPFENISRMQMREIAKDPGARVRAVRDLEQPCMVEVSIHSMQPQVAPIYGFGNAIDKEKKVPRSFVAHPEFIILSRYADVEVKSLWRGKEYWAMVPDLPEVVKDFLLDRYTEYSWTAGVIAETLWRSVVLGEDKGKAGPMRGDEERAQTSWPGLWIRAADKSSMFMVSLRLGELGYAVQSYGLGWVRCAVPEEDIPAFMKDGLTLGLVPQLLDIPDNLFLPNQRVPWEGDPKSAAIAHLTMTKSHRLLWNLDKIPTLPPERRKDAVRSLQKQHSTQSA
jgi:hypothetical protein